MLARTFLPIIQQCKPFHTKCHEGDLSHPVFIQLGFFLTYPLAQVLGRPYLIISMNNSPKPTTKYYEQSYFEVLQDYMNFMLC